MAAIKRLDIFKRKVSKNGILLENARNNNEVIGYAFKTDIKQFFDSTDQETLITIIKRKIKDDKVIWLISSILKNFDNKIKGMPLGNMTSQFFANIYLNELDYFIKHKLKMKYYLRYVDDFIILHKNRRILKESKKKISKYIKNLKLELHPNKSKIFSIYKGVGLLGFRVFYHYKLLRKRNITQFNQKLLYLEKKFKKELISHEKIIESVEGWFAYVRWGNTYNLRKNVFRKFNIISNNNTIEAKNGGINLFSRKTFLIK